MMRRHNQRGIFSFLAVVLCASLLFARQGVVKTRDGQTYEGDINESEPAFVTVSVHGIQTRLDRAKVATISYVSASQDLAQQLARTNLKDGPANLAIARQAFTQQQYIVARDAVERVLAVDPNNADAVSLRDTIQSQMRLERTRQRPPEEPRPAAPVNPAPATTVPADQKVLRPSDINAIRQAEMRPEDTGVRIRFERGVQRRFVDFLGKDRAAEFYALNSMQQAQWILTKGPPEMRQDITIQNDPPALLQYRRSVQPFIILNCATSGCHGGNSAASKFQLIVPPESDAATYTNFYILTKYSQASRQEAGSVFGHGDLRLIDRQRAEGSLLIQFAMPGSMAEHAHPDVQGFRPPLRGANDPRYRQLIDWIGTSLPQLEHDYGFEFRTPATQPASRPASAPATPTTKPPATHPVRMTPRPAGQAAGGA